MRAAFRGVRAAGTMAVLACAGCSSSPDTRLYLLSPLPAEEAGRAPAAGAGPVVGVRPVSLPEHLDRAQIVTQVGPNQLALSELDQWGAPLRDNFTRVLAENLGMLLRTERVVPFPWSRETPVEYDVAVTVARFDATLRGECRLVADWTVVRRGGKGVPSSGRSAHTERAGETYAELVAAQSRLVGALSRDIAAAASSN